MTILKITFQTISHLKCGWTLDYYASSITNQLYEMGKLVDHQKSKSSKTNENGDKN